MNKFSGDAKLNPVLHGLRTEASGEFKRPDHPDFLTSAELKEKLFSGMRDHRMAMEYEIWVVGELVKRISYKDVERDPFAITKAMMEYIGEAP